ncbi:MAG: DUF2066 domain-containing protein [Gammaproteobacteria bacterium]|jgi:hypothetical protein|nr:DUF2066 domain-containing protein [Gammaproteobacteria bacterium]
MVNPKKLWLLAGLLVSLTGAPQAFGAVLAHLYDVTLPVQSQSEDEWQQLVQQGLGQVLERASGDTNVSASPQVKKALDSAHDYVEQYAYEGNNLTIKYSADLVNQLLEKTGQAVWGQRRPNVVLWLAIEDNQQRRIVGAETDPALHTYLSQFAKQKGIPLILPLMDLEDMSAVTVTDVWGQFPAVLSQASERYGAQIILLGRVTHGSASAAWEGNWQLLTRADVPAWKVQGQSLEEILSQGISQSTQFLKVNPTQNNAKTLQAARGKPFLIGIEGIQSSNDFAEIEKYLKSLDQVVDVNIHQLLGQVAVFEVTPRQANGFHSLEQTIAMDSHLIPALNSVQGVSGVESVYRWVSKPASLLPSAPQAQEMNLPPDPAPTSALWGEEAEVIED